MNIRIFNKTYTLRRFGTPKNIGGYTKSTYTDSTVSLHLHPLSTDQLQALPEGERTVKRIEGHGEIALITADQTTGQKGDLVYYYGEWYKCESCQCYDHTILNHYNYQFVRAAQDGAAVTDLAAPAEDTSDSTDEDETDETETEESEESGDTTEEDTDDDSEVTDEGI